MTTGTNLFLDGHPVYFVDGKAYVLKQTFSIDDLMKDQMERASLRWNHYRCPFDFMTQFDKWIEWKRREHGDREPSGSIMASMIANPKDAKQYQIERTFQFRVFSSYTPSFKPSNLIRNCVF